MTLKRQYEGRSACDRTIRALAVASLVSVTACATVGPDFVQPEAPVNDQWLEADAQHFRATPQELTQWWGVFEDPVLEELVRLTHERNNNRPVQLLQ